jgi:hypothetical protein
MGRTLGGEEGDAQGHKEISRSGGKKQAPELAKN